MSCEYLWKTTSKKGTKCGRKLNNTNEQYCWQHKSVIKKNNKEFITTETDCDGSLNKSTFIQLENTKNKLTTKDKPNKKYFSMTSSSTSESKSDSESDATTSSNSSSSSSSS